METKEGVIEKGVVHFSIGEGFGKMLMEIAQEHLIYTLDPIKAVETLTKSLPGLPQELAFKILKGTLVLITDIKTQEVTVRDREEGDESFPKIDLIDLMIRWRREIITSGQQIVNNLFYWQNEIRGQKGRFKVDLDYEIVFKFIAGNNEALLDELREDEKILDIKSSIEISKNWIERTTKLRSTMKWIFMSFEEFNNSTGVQKYTDFDSECRNSVLTVLQTLQATLNVDIPKFIQKHEENTKIIEYLKITREIKETIDKGLEPVDINLKWDAGWLSPNGDYYALNGDIANMLHNQIADALQEKGIIPNSKNESGNYEIHADSWLEENGWVKIHRNSIHFGGCLNNRLGKPIVDITDTQIKIINEYGRDHCNGILKMGWRLETVTPTMFLMFSRDRKALYKKFFNFD